MNIIHYIILYFITIYYNAFRKYHFIKQNFTQNLEFMEKMKLRAYKIQVIYNKDNQFFF